MFFFFNSLDPTLQYFFSNPFHPTMCFFRESTWSNLVLFFFSQMLWIQPCEGEGISVVRVMVLRGLIVTVL